MFNTTFNFTEFPFPNETISLLSVTCEQKTKNNNLVSASENRLRVYPWTVRLWLESEHDNFFFPPFSRLYNEKITRNAENVPHLALIKRTASIKIIKTTHEWSFRRALSRRWKISTRNIAQVECFWCRNSQQCTEFPSKRFSTLLAISAPSFIAFDSLVKRNLSGPTQWKAEWKFLPGLISPLFILSRAPRSLPEITGGGRRFDFIRSFGVFRNNDHHRRLCRRRVLETNKQIKY